MSNYDETNEIHINTHYMQIVKSQRKIILKAVREKQLSDMREPPAID